MKSIRPLWACVQSNRGIAEWRTVTPNVCWTQCHSAQTPDYIKVSEPLFLDYLDGVSLFLSFARRHSFTLYTGYTFNKNRSNLIRPCGNYTIRRAHVSQTLTSFSGLDQDGRFMSAYSVRTFTNITSGHFLPVLPRPSSSLTFRICRRCMCAIYCQSRRYSLRDRCQMWHRVARIISIELELH